MYGCGDAKLAKTAGKPEKEGKKLKEAFWKANPAIKSLISDLEKAYDLHPGYIIGIDGRKLRVRDKRKLLNTLLQNGATIVFKKWMIAIDDEAPPLHQLIAYHDELQFELNSTHLTAIETAVRGVLQLATEVGEDMKLNVKIEADCKTGYNYAECH